MRILIVTPLFDLSGRDSSGIAIYLRTMAQELVELGHEIHVLFASENCAKTRSFRRGDIQIHQIHLQPPGWFRRRGLGRIARLFGMPLWYPSFRNIVILGRMIERLADRYSIDLVETTNVRGFCFYYLLRFHSTPVVTRVATTGSKHTEINEGERDFGERMNQFFEGAAIGRSDGLVTHSEEHRKQICLDLSLPIERFTVIPLGIEIPEESEMKSRPIVGRDLTVLFVGRLERRKGIDILLKAIPIVLQNEKDVEFVLIGRDEGGGFAREFEINNDCEVRRRVAFKGEVDSETLQAAYRDCDIFVAPSRYESFGLIYVEAMSFGKPAIGCRVGGIPEVIDDGKTGLLAKPDDVGDLVEKVLSLLRSKETRESMGQHARERAAGLFSSEAMATGMASYYDSVLAEFGRR